jgi:hypothetical protein
MGNDLLTGLFDYRYGTQPAPAAHSLHISGK